MTLTPEQIRYLRNLAEGGPVRVRDKTRSPVLDALLELRLVQMTEVGRASMTFGISPTGRAELLLHDAERDVAG